MRKILKSIGKALRRMFRALRNGAAWTASAIGGVVGGLLGGGGYVDEPDDDYVEDGTAEQLVEDTRPAPEPSIGRRVKDAVNAMDRGRSPSLAFDMSDARQAAMALWMTGLSQSAISTLRHAPVAAIERHLDPRDPWCCAGLPAFASAAAANGNAPAVKAEASKSFSFREIDAVDETEERQRTFA